MSIKVLIVEDDETWRMLFQLMLKGENGIEIIGEYERAEEALENIERLSPDVAVVDLSLPGMAGNEFAEKLKQYPAIKVLIVTAYDQDYIAGLGLDGCAVVNKTYSEELVGKIRELGGSPG
jgi:DNA-binding NarL/FixJ family response regulator